MIYNGGGKDTPMKFGNRELSKKEIFLIIKCILAGLAVLNLILLFGFEYGLPDVLARENAAAVATTSAAAVASTEAPTAPEPEPEPEPQKVMGRVTSNSPLRVRSGPGTEHDQLGSVKPGEEVEILGGENNWYHIVTEEGLEGYVSGDYIEIVE